MIESQGSITRWIEDLAGGDCPQRDLAAEALWQRFASQLIPLARRALDQRTRRREDEEDVVLSVFASFCQRVYDGKFNLADRDDLWRLLVAMTTFKSRRLLARHRRQRRDARREKAPPSEDGAEPVSWSDLLDDSGPTALDAITLVDELERKLALLDTTCRQVATLRLEGHSNREIASRLNTAERTIERKLQRIRRIWLAEAESESQSLP